VNTLLDLVTSPLGPALVLLTGAAVQLGYGRWVRRSDWLTGLALFFVTIALALHWALREQLVVPTFSLPWQPILQSGTNLLWVGDGWNWYIAGLVLLLGGLGILLDLNGEPPSASNRVYVSLSVNLAVLAAALLFVGSGNLLTAILTWVVLDILVLLRGVLRTEPSAGGEESHARVLSLVGALSLLIGLLPAGPRGPSMEFQTGGLPFDAVLFVGLAAAIRAGLYPFHLWLVPQQQEHTNVAERLLEHLVPVLCGLWLMGWAFQLGSKTTWLRVEFIGL
jgi:hypothetical protein